MSKEKLAIIGIGEVPTEINPERSQWDIIYDTCIEATRDAGIDKKDIEGVISANPMAQPAITSELAFGKLPEELGLNNCKDTAVCNAGGASSTNSLKLAEQWIQTGSAKIVLISHTTVHSTIPREDAINFFATAGMDLQWEYPFGTTYNGLFGMLTQRYMYETGTTMEELASVVVALRKWGAMDPNSIFYKKEVPSIEQILSSPMVSTPLHRRECNLLADGGAAMIVTSAELAKEITKTPVYKLGDAVTYESASILMRHDFFLRDTFGYMAKKAMSDAGITTDDIDIFEFYGAYPVLQCVFLEAVGICKPGEAGKFITEGHTSPGGKCPCATIGDAIGRGHTGSGVGMAYYVETARQLMGKAGERQVPNCNYVLYNTSGGSGMNVIVTIFGRELQ